MIFATDANLACRMLRSYRLASQHKTRQNQENWGSFLAKVPLGARATESWGNPPMVAGLAPLWHLDFLLRKMGLLVY